MEAFCSHIWVNRVNYTRNDGSTRVIARASRIILNSDSDFLPFSAPRFDAIVESESCKITLKCRLFLRWNGVRQHQDSYVGAVARDGETQVETGAREPRKGECLWNLCRTWRAPHPGQLDRAESSYCVKNERKFSSRNAALHRRDS